MIANYDRCHLMRAARKKSHPTELYPARSRTNIVSAREIGRQLEGRRKAMSQKHISGTAKRLEKIVCFPENQGWFVAGPSAGAGYSGSFCLADCVRLTWSSSNRSAGLATRNQTGRDGLSPPDAGRPP